MEASPGSPTSTRGTASSIAASTGSKARDSAERSAGGASGCSAFGAHPGYHTHSVRAIVHHFDSLHHSRHPFSRCLHHQVTTFQPTVAPFDAFPSDLSGPQPQI